MDQGSNNTEAKQSQTRRLPVMTASDCMSSVLFDPGSTFSYVSSSFANGLNLHCELLDMPINDDALV